MNAKQIDMQPYQDQLGVVFYGLLEADKIDQRRPYMNALLRIAALICHESDEPKKAFEMAKMVMEAALNEDESTPNLIQ
jgi:hypothetical protein